MVGDSTGEANRLGKNSRASILHRTRVSKNCQCNERHPSWEVQAAVSGHSKPTRARKGRSAADVSWPDLCSTGMDFISCVAGNCGMV